VNYRFSKTLKFFLIFNIRKDLFALLKIWTDKSGGCLSYFMYIFTNQLGEFKL